MKTGFVILQTGFVLLQTGFEIKIKIGVSVGCHKFIKEIQIKLTIKAYMTSGW